MFERFTESARRSVFFARGAAIELGSPTIEPHHLLLAILRELQTPGRTNDLPSVTASLHVEVETSVKWDSTHKEGDVPFSPATKRVLVYSEQEANDLHHFHIGPEHLLLGVLRGDERLAAELKSEGVTLQGIRTLAAEANPQP